MTNEDVLPLLRRYEKEALSPTNSEFYKACGDEIEQLRSSLTILRDCMLRMTCSTPGVIHLRREDWSRAFAPLIVPPYNLLRWQQDEPTKDPKEP